MSIKKIGGALLLIALTVILAYGGDVFIALLVLAIILNLNWIFLVLAAAALWNDLGVTFLILVIFAVISHLTIATLAPRVSNLYSIQPGAQIEYRVPR